jgi:hypothetical protein
MVYIQIANDITILVSLTSIELEYKEISRSFIETLEDDLSGHPVPSTADSTVPNSAHKPIVEQSSDTLKNHSYMYKIGAVAGVLLTVGVGV